MNKATFLSIGISVIALCISIYTAITPRKVDSATVEAIKNEVYQTIVKEVGEELRPIYKDMGIDIRDPKDLKTLMSPFFQPLSKK